MKIVFLAISTVLIGLGIFGLSRNNESVKTTIINADPARKSAFVYADPNPFVQQAIREFESFIKMTLANRQAPGAALAVVKDTSVIFLKGYGFREFGKPDSIDARTVFRIGSVSKSVTATLCA